MARVNNLISGKQVHFGQWVAKSVGIAAVTAGILAGSVHGAVAAAAERSLGGVKIFSPMSVVVKKYGSPDEVRVGNTTTGGASAAGASGGLGGYPGAGGGPGGYPGAGGGPGGYPGAAGGSGASEYGGGASADDTSSDGGDGASGYPGAGGPGGYPGAGGYPGGPGGYPGAGGTGAAAQAKARASLVTWVYDQPSGNTLEFTFSNDGRVIQIRATGYHPLVKTARGVTLGMKLSDVVSRYGAPEKSSIRGKVFTQDYSGRYHASFQFYNSRLVGIIVAAVE